MNLSFMMISPAERKRQFKASPRLTALQFQRISAVIFVAASLSESDLPGNRAATCFAKLPEGTSDRTELLTSLLAWDFDPAEILRAPGSHLASWYSVAGDVSVMAPGLFLLHQATAAIQDGFSWSPGQVSDILQTLLHARSILQGHGIANRPSADTAIEDLHSFLSLAHTYDGCVLARS